METCSHIHLFDPSDVEWWSIVAARFQDSICVHWPAQFCTCCDIGNTKSMYLNALQSSPVLLLYSSLSNSWHAEERNTMGVSQWSHPTIRMIKLCLIIRSFQKECFWKKTHAVYIIIVCGDHISRFLYQTSFLCTVFRTVVGYMVTFYGYISLQ